MDAIALKERTLGRSAALWQDWGVDDLTVGLQALENLVNRLGQDIMRQPLAILEGAAQFEAIQRNKLYDLEMEEVSTHVTIAKEKFATQMQVLAYKVAGEEVLLAAKRYDVAILSFIMSAKEFAAEVEREQIALQRERAQMDIKKEEAHLEEVKSRILLEYAERAQVQVDIARARMQVAQANVRAVMAGIEAQEAELKVIQAELEVAMVDAERATLIADIAMIYADIIVRGLAKIRLAVGTAEIEAGFEFIQQKLDDLLELWDTRTSIQKMSATYEALLRTEIDEQTTASIFLEDLKKTQQKAEIELFFFEKDKMDGSDLIPEMRKGGRSIEDQQELHEALEGSHFEGFGMTITECEILRQDNLFEEKKAFVSLKTKADVEHDKIRTWAELLVDAARRKAGTYRVLLDYELHDLSQRIHKGEFYVSLPGPEGVDLDSTPPIPRLEGTGVNDEHCEAPPYQGPEDM